MNTSNLKEIVKEKYSHIARHSDKNPESCCGGGCADDFTTFSDSYEHLEGYDPDADLGLGCGIPTDHSGIKPGDTVVDLGSGAGNDCFVARAIVGENGRVIGLDFSDDMLAKARKNAQKMGYTNVEFIQGDIEEMPLESNVADVVVSNCVLNLVPDKQKAFSEIFRILKPNGHFCISDVVLNGLLPEALKNAAEMYAGCVSGAMQMQEYLNIIQQNGFKNIQVHKQKKLEIPEEIVRMYLNEEEMEGFLKGFIGLFSITVSGEKC